MRKKNQNDKVSLYWSVSSRHQENSFAGVLV